MYIAMGFAAACAIYAYMGADFWKYPAAALLVLILCLIGGKRHLGRKLMLSCMGCVLGFCWFSYFHFHYLEPILSLDGKERFLTVRASDYGERTEYATCFGGIVTLDGKNYQIQTWLKEDAEVEPGLKISGTFALRVVDTGIRPGQGIFLAASQRDTVTMETDAERWWDAVAKFRREIKNTLKEMFPEDAQPFVKALFLGDASDFSYALDTDLKISGVRHVVAVSGLHISILFGLLSMVTFRRRFLMALVGYPVLFFFAALTGFTPSVVRACLMAGLMLLAKLTDRDYDGPTALSFAVLVMLMINPLVITAVGFQLSVASVAGIFLFTPAILNWMRSFFDDVKGRTVKSCLIRWGTASVALTLGAGILTTPLCAYYFGTVSLVGVITNLLTLWLISGVFYGIMAVCILFPLAPGAAAAIAGVIAWPVRYVLWVVEKLADFPLAAVYTGSIYITVWLFFVYGMLTLFLISRNRRPGIFACCAVLGLSLALTADCLESMNHDVRVTVLDVGQGQSILLQSEGRSFLVDCGGDYAAEAADQAAEALLIQGIRKLDGLILTHLDQDHTNGAEGFMNRIKTELLILPEEYSDLQDRTDARVICVAENTDITLGETIIRLFPPTFPGNGNEKSLCVLFDTEKCDILITGDRDGYGERSLLRNAEIPDVDILIAGHHGAASSTCEELLAAVKPEIVCISAGAGNFYGHPAPALLQRLAAYGCDIFRTDIQGTITIRR